MDENKNNDPVDMRVTGGSDNTSENTTSENANFEANTNNINPIIPNITNNNSEDAGNVGIVIPNASSTSIEGEISDEVKKAAEKYAEMYGGGIKKEDGAEKTKEQKADELKKELDSLDLDEGTYVVDSAPFSKAIEAMDNNRKKNFKFILIAVAAVLIMVIGMVALNYKVIGNFIKKKTLSPEEYTQYILSENSKKNSAFYRALYEKHITNGIFSDNIDATSSLSFQITEDGFDFLDDMDVDVDDIEDLEMFKNPIKVSYSGKHYKDFSELTLTFTSGKKDMYGADIIFDKANQMVYFGLPQFGKEYAAISLSDLYTDEEIDDFFTVIDSIDHVGEILISGKQLESIINRYADIVIANIDDVDMSTDTLEVGDLKKKVAVIEIEVDKYLAMDMAQAVLEEFIEDEEIKKIVEDISTLEYIEDADEFVEGYEDILEMIEDNMDDISESAADMDFTAILTLYVDNQGQIIGNKVVSEYENYFYDPEVSNFVTTTDTSEIFSAYIISGTKFAAEMSSTEGDRELFSIEGEGKAAGTKLSGTFTVSNYDDELEFEVQGLDWSKYNKGIIDGKISLAFDQFGKEIPKEVRDLVLVINLNGSKDTYGIELLEEKTLLIKAEISTEIKKANISAPKNTVSVEDGDDMVDYLDSLDFTSLEDMLDEMDVDDPDDRIDDLKDSMGGIMDGGLPIEILLVPEIGVPTNPFVPVTAGIMAPQFIKYVEKSRISQDVMLADTIKTAIVTAMCDPAVITADDGSQDTIDSLEYGVDITTWGKPSNKFEEAVADILGISDFSKLDKEIKSKYTGEGIWATYDSYYSTVTIELKNTDRYGWGDLSGYYNITSY